MGHPIFDEITYPFYREEADRFYKLLYQLVPVAANITLLYDRCGPGLFPLTTTVAPHLIWQEALRNITANGYLRKFCEIIKATYPGNLGVQNAIVELENALPMNQVKILSNNTVILDRDNLRDQISLLSPEETQVKVLLVRGGPKSGKSHSRLLFIQTAKRYGSKHVYFFNGDVGTVDEVIERLFSALGDRNAIPAKDTTGSAYYRKVILALKEVAQSKNQMLWVAFDDLGLSQDNAGQLDPLIKEFCDEFVLQFQNSDFNQWFRLMLIDYPEGKLPAQWKTYFWTEDRTSESDVKENDVVQGLQSWYASHNKTIIEDELKLKASQLITEAENTSSAANSEFPRLHCIHEQLVKTLRELNRGLS